MSTAMLIILEKFEFIFAKQLKTFLKMSTTMLIILGMFVFFVFPLYFLFC